MTCDKCKDDITKLMGICNPPKPDCHKHECGCGTEKEDCCGCPQPISGVASLSDEEPWVYRFNYGGRSVWLDTKPGVEKAQTDTSLTVSNIPRGLSYQAERHTDFIGAGELGNMMRLADIGDVDVSGVQDNSLFVYRINPDCADGSCMDNSWGAWNATDSQNRKTSAQTILGFDADGSPASIQPPANTNQYYDFGWNAQGKASYNQPVSFASFPLDDQNNAYIMCVDPKTMQQGYVKVAKGTTITV